jgi:hypothetical protein
MTYREALEATKSSYPFDNWRELFKPVPEEDFDGMEQYSPENCDKAQNIIDNLITGLLSLGENAGEQEKLNLFEKALLELNALDNEIEGLIETGEREDLCELIDRITTAAGLDPEDYADGGGIADLWREW